MEVGPPARRALPFLYGTVTLDVIGIGIIAPVTPALITELAGGGLAQAAVYGGWLVALFALMQFFAAPIVGNLSDRFGRRPVLLVTLLLYGASYLFMGLANSIPLLFAARCISGVTSATNSTANAYLADITAPADRARQFGKMGAAFAAGWIFGPALGGFLGEYGARVPFHVAAGLAFCNVVYGYFFLPESLPPEQRRSFGWRSANPLGSLLYLRRFSKVLDLIGAQMILMMANAALAVVWPYYAVASFGWTAGVVGLSIAVFGTLNVLVQGFLMRFVTGGIGDSRTLQLAVWSSVLGYLGFAFAPAAWVAVLAIGFWAVSSMANPTLNAILSRRVPPDSQGALAGAVASLQSLMGVVMPIAMTGVFGYFTSSRAPIYFPGAAYLCSACIAAIGGIVMTRVLRAAVVR